MEQHNLKPLTLGSPEQIAWVKVLIRELTPKEAEQYRRNSYWLAVWHEALEHEPPGSTFFDVIDRDQQHYEAMRIERHRQAKHASKAE
jgi:hypothetical protein